MSEVKRETYWGVEVNCVMKFIDKKEKVLAFIEKAMTEDEYIEQLNIIRAWYTEQEFLNLPNFEEALAEYRKLDMKQFENKVDAKNPYSEEEKARKKKLKYIINNYYPGNSPLTLFIELDNLRGSFKEQANA